MNRKYSLPLLLAAFTNLILFLIKLYIGIRTNSLCIYSDSINNLFDTISLVIAFLGTLFLTKAATQRHPFGFGRIEYILEFVMSVMITITGLSFAYSSLLRLTMPTPVWFYDKYAYIVAGTCLVKLCLGLFFQWKQKKEKSDVFKTVMLDSYLDTTVTLVALLSFTLTNKVGVVVDGYLGLFISLLISASGIRLICSSVSRLLGQSNEKLEYEIQKELFAFAPEVQIRFIYIYDYGIERKHILLSLNTMQKANQIALQHKIKAELSKKFSATINIEWEDT